MMVRYELKKVFARPGSVIALLLLVGLLLVTVWAAVDVTYVNEAGESEHGYAATQKLRAMQKEWAGVLDEEKLRAAITENQRILAMPEAMSEDYQLQDKAFHHKQGYLEIFTCWQILFRRGFKSMIIVFRTV